MKSLKVSLKGVCFFVISLTLIASQVAYASDTARNRNDVFKVLNNLNAEMLLPSLDFWVNEKAYEPTVNIDDLVYFTIDSATPAFYTLLHVDSKGSTSVLLPQAKSLTQTGAGDTYLVYPPLLDSCTAYQANEACFDRRNQLKQIGPIGQDTVFLLASNQPIGPEVLGVADNQDFKELGKDLRAIEGLVQSINSQAIHNPLSIVRYSYSVESVDTQYSTRAIKRSLRKLEQLGGNVQPVVAAAQIDASMNFNNINFSFNSSALTPSGKVELDGLGSVLVGMQAENGEFPVLQLAGHTDSTGPAAYNLTLSADRAKSTKQYLVREHGVPASQIVTIGAGESDPIDSNKYGAGRAQNRRVELKVLAAL